MESKIAALSVVLSVVCCLLLFMHMHTLLTTSLKFLYYTCTSYTSFPSWLPASTLVRQGSRLAQGFKPSSFKRMQNAAAAVNCCCCAKIGNQLFCFFAFCVLRFYWHAAVCRRRRRARRARWRTCSRQACQPRCLLLYCA